MLTNLVRATITGMCGARWVSSLLALVVSVPLSGCWLTHGRDDDDDADADADADGDADLGVVDLLVLVDNNGAMAQEQATLTAAFPSALQGFLPDIQSLHLGVIDTDMGTGGFAVQTCRDAIDGDDGILRNTPSGAVAGCQDSYPSYLSFLEGDDASQLDADFDCIATLGTGGCGFQQHLKAVRKALTTHAEGANAGFLRPGSLLAILIVSNEDDCSIRTDTADATDIFNTQLDLGPLNLRCYRHGDQYAEPVASFVDSLLSIRSAPDLVVAGIVGLPPDDTHQCNLVDPTEREFGCILDLPRMQEVVDESAEGKGERLTPSCDVAGLGEAFPPRRIVELVRDVVGAGGKGFVRSICEPDLELAMSQMGRAISERVTR